MGYILIRQLSGPSGKPVKVEKYSPDKFVDKFFPTEELPDAMRRKSVIRNGVYSVREPNKLIILIDKLEKQLNHGMTAEEAIVTYPKMKMHNSVIFKVDYNT